MATTFLSAPRGYPYTTWVQRYGGRPPYTWSISAGALPTGLALDANGNVTGTVDPYATLGAWNFTVRLTDGIGRYGEKAFTINVVPGDDMPLPRLTYTSVTQVSVGAAPGDPGSPTIRCILQDNVERTVAGPLTWDITVAGQGGRDAGAEGASEWWYLYLVPQTAAPTTTLAIIGSKTAPTAGGPTGYTNYRYVGAVYNDAGSNLVKFWQRVRDLFEWDIFQAAESIDAAGTDATNQSVNLTAYVPACAATVTGVVQFETSDAINVVYVDLYNEGYVGGSDTTKLTCFASQYGSLGACATLTFEVPIIDATPAIARRRRAGGGAGPAFYRMRLTGYRDAYL